MFLLISQLELSRFADRDMFVRFTGGGIGHQNTAFSTRFIRDALLKLFGLNFYNDASNEDFTDPVNVDNLGDENDAPEDEELEDADIQSDIDEADSTDCEDDGGECGVDEEDELGFGGF